MTTSCPISVSDQMTRVLRKETDLWTRQTCGWASQMEHLWGSSTSGCGFATNWRQLHWAPWVTAPQLSYWQRYYTGIMITTAHHCVRQSWDKPVSKSAIFENPSIFEDLYFQAHWIFFLQNFKRFWKPYVCFPTSLIPSKRALQRKSYSR